MKVALVYTSSTPELIGTVEEEVRRQLGTGVELITFRDPTILAEVREAGYVPPRAAARLMGIYLQAAERGADAILNLCSSVGEAAEAFQSAAEYIGVPVVRVELEMCREAVRQGSRVGVLATVPTALEPIAHALAGAGRAVGKRLKIVEGLVDSFGADREHLSALLIEAAAKMKDRVDLIVLAQGSMACAEQEIEKTVGIKTLSCLRFGVKALKKALQEKGINP